RAWMVWLVGKGRGAEPEAMGAVGAAGPAPIARMKPVFDGEIGQFVSAAVIQRNAMQEGSTFRGPAVIIEDQTTTFVPSSFAGSVNAHGHLVLMPPTAS